MKSCRRAPCLNSRTGMRGCDVMKKSIRMIWISLLMMVLAAGALAETPKMVVRDFEEWSFDTQAPEDGYNGDQIYKNHRSAGPFFDEAIIWNVIKAIFFYVAACLIVNHFSPDNKLVRILFLSCLFDHSGRVRYEDGDIYDLSRYDDEPGIGDYSFSESDDPWGDDSNEETEWNEDETDEDGSLDFDIDCGDFDSDSD